MAAAKAFRLPLPESSLKTTLEQQTKLPLKAADECNTITPARPPAGIVFPPFMERDMKKLLPLALICTAAFAHAHEVWVNAPAELPAKSSLKAELAYSAAAHHFARRQNRRAQAAGRKLPIRFRQPEKRQLHRQRHL